MPIKFNLEELRKKHNCSNFFETGLWDPRCNITSKKALLCNFKKIYCIEIREDWVKLGKQIFKDDIISGRYNLILDDSTNMEKYINNNDFKEKTMFFLDAHVDNKNIKKYKKKCPIFEEVNAIKSLNRKDNIILIDDLRLLKNPFPWNEKTYGNIDFKKSIKNLILSINKNYKFLTLDGFIENDVLCAYI